MSKKVKKPATKKMALAKSIERYERLMDSLTRAFSEFSKEGCSVCDYMEYENIYPADVCDDCPLEHSEINGRPLCEEAYPDACFAFEDVLLCMSNILDVLRNTHSMMEDGDE